MESRSAENYEALPQDTSPVNQKRGDTEVLLKGRCLSGVTSLWKSVMIIYSSSGCGPKPFFGSFPKLSTSDEPEKSSGQILSNVGHKGSDPHLLEMGVTPLTHTELPVLGTRPELLILVQDCWQNTTFTPKLRGARYQSESFQRSYFGPITRC